MSKLTDIRRLLLHLRLKLIEYLGDQGLTVDDPEFVLKTEELNRLNDILAILLRDLKSAHHGAETRERNLWNIPRGMRYAPTSAVKNQQSEISELTTEASEIQKLVEDLLRRICTGNEMEGVHNVAELIEKVSHGYESGSASQLALDQPAYVPYVSAHPQAGPESGGNHGVRGNPCAGSCFQEIKE